MIASTLVAVRPSSLHRADPGRRVVARFDNRPVLGWGKLFAVFGVMIAVDGVVPSPFTADLAGADRYLVSIDIEVCGHSCLQLSKGKS